MGAGPAIAAISPRCRARCRACRRRGRRRSAPARPASPRCRRRRPTAAGWPGTSSRPGRGACGALRAIAAAMTGSIRLAFSSVARLVALDELGQHLPPEQLDRLHDVLVPVAPGLQHEDDLVDAGLLVAAEVLADLVRGADGAPQPGRVTGGHLGAQRLLLDRPGHGLRVEALRRSPLLVLAPHVGHAGPVLAEDVEVAEGVAEEVGALDAAADGLVLVVVQHHRAHAGHLRVDATSPPARTLGQRALVLADPAAGLLGVDEGEGERADALLGREEDGVAPGARDPQRRVRLLHRLGHDVAGRHLHVLAVDAGEGLLGHAADGHLEALQPRVALLSGVDAEAAQLGLARRLARAELDPAVRDEVEHRHPLGRAGRVVEPGAVRMIPWPRRMCLRALAAGGQEHLGCRRVAVLLEEVVLDLPHVLDAEAVGQLDLLERVLDEPVLGVRLPRAAPSGARRRSRTSWTDVNTRIHMSMTHAPRRLPRAERRAQIAAGRRDDVRPRRLRRHVDGRRGPVGGRHAAHRVPHLHVEGGALPGRPRAGDDAARRGVRRHRR